MGLVLNAEALLDISYHDQVVSLRLDEAVIGDELRPLHGSVAINEFETPGEPSVLSTWMQKGKRYSADIEHQPGVRTM